MGMSLGRDEEGPVGAVMGSGPEHIPAAEPNVTLCKSVMLEVDEPDELCVVMSVITASAELQKLVLAEL